MHSRARQTFAFSVFVFNAETRELLRDGTPAPIPSQTANLLTILLVNSGAMVTREELRAQLWPAGEVIDYDRSINRSISELRTILREHPRKPAQHIDTLPKRGYRFITPVRILPAIDIQHEETLPKPVQSTAVPAAEERGLFSFPENLPSGRSSAAIRWPKVLLWTSMAMLFLLAVGSGTYRQWRRKPVTPANRSFSLGLVPFKAVGDGAPGLAESFRSDLADSLSEIPTIQVRATHSFDNLGQEEAPAEARAQSLGIDFILFGTLTVSGDQCSLAFELVRSRDGMHLRSLRYVGRKAELATMRDHIEKDIFDKLNPSWMSSALNISHPLSPSAYASYLQGRADLADWTDDSLHRSIQAFEDALRDKPDYARAYAGEASAYYVLGERAPEGSDADFGRSRSLASKAVAIDPSLAEAHAILGNVALSKDWNFATANDELQKAVQLDPYHAVYHMWLSTLYSLERKDRLAFEQIDSAHRADPEWDAVYISEIFVAETCGDKGRADRASAMLIQRRPKWSTAHEERGLVLWSLKRYLAAINEWHSAALLDKNVDRERLEEQGVVALRKGGVVGYARLRLNAMTRRKGVSYARFDFQPAEWHAYAGDRDLALLEIKSLVDHHAMEALQIPSNPAFEGLHQEVQFNDAVKRLGLPN